MIIGKGLIANALGQYSISDDVLVFASGVSNSLEQNPKAFFREKELLKRALIKYKNLLFIYFGTCSVYDESFANSPYVQHKINMEKIISKSGVSFLIFRLPQVIGESNNESTLLNFLYRNIVSGKTFDLWSEAIRYVVDIDDVSKFVSFVIHSILQRNLIVNLFTLPCKVVDIVKDLEDITGKKANYNLINKGVLYSIPASTPELTLLKAGIAVDENYLHNVLVKYYKGLNC